MEGKSNSHLWGGCCVYGDNKVQENRYIQTACSLLFYVI